jgi:hypothetical protein
MRPLARRVGALNAFRAGDKSVRTDVAILCCRRRSIIQASSLVARFGNPDQATLIISSRAILRWLHHYDLRLQVFGSHDRRRLRQHPLHNPVAKYERMRQCGRHVGADHQEQ